MYFAQPLVENSSEHGSPHDGTPYTSAPSKEASAEPAKEITTEITTETTSTTFDRAANPYGPAYGTPFTVDDDYDFEDELGDVLPIDNYRDPNDTKHTEEEPPEGAICRSTRNRTPKAARNEARATTGPDTRRKSPRPKRKSRSTSPEEKESNASRTKRRCSGRVRTTPYDTLLREAALTRGQAPPPGSERKSPQLNFYNECLTTDSERDNDKVREMTDRRPEGTSPATSFDYGLLAKSPSQPRDPDPWPSPSLRHQSPLPASLPPLDFIPDDRPLVANPRLVVYPVNQPMPVNDPVERLPPLPVQKSSWNNLPRAVESRLFDPRPVIDSFARISTLPDIAPSPVQRSSSDNHLKTIDPRLLDMTSSQPKPKSKGGSRNKHGSRDKRRSRDKRTGNNASTTQIEPFADGLHGEMKTDPPKESCKPSGIEIGESFFDNRPEPILSSGYMLSSRSSSPEYIPGHAQQDMPPREESIQDNGGGHTNPNTYRSLQTDDPGGKAQTAAKVK
ncbi:hypothetical protein M011DRAFT_454675 [Sporormia fimetaria CBS 119925]|uniref:Uncharacterized protein n=1 Tax=Sporormia fimetaria CBS 119925 TaxID=1340428 RepID=A0A6A6VNP1_9PLEO|nr:hypothetical protein M011DRAFT_454675 [Sporormia fimetaria CBS 119925]